MQGNYEENTLTLRLKHDMKSKNPSMRDLAYRICKTPHFRTGNKYNVNHPTIFLIVLSISIRKATLYLFK